VSALADARQSYAVYVPSKYDPSRRWPVLYCLDPGARGWVPVERFAQAAEAEGFLVFGSNNSRNGPVMAAREAIEAMWRDTHHRFAIDDARAYAAGHSGGARMALEWAMAGGVAGVVAGGAGFGRSPLPERIPFAIFFAAGTEDFNGPEIFEQSAALARAGRQRWHEFEGGHEWLPAEAAHDALRFLSGGLDARPAVMTPERRRAIARFRDATAAFEAAGENARARMAKQWAAQSAAPADTPERRLARQALGGLYVGAMEAARAAAASQDARAQAEAWRTATLLRPDSPQPWYSLAVAEAALGRRKQALDALAEAARRGFQDWARADAEPRLEKVRQDPRYAALRPRP
jgi:predicted esterase